MKASIRRKYGSSNQIKIEDIEKPTLKDNAILIKVHAATVNRTDCANLTAKPFIIRLMIKCLVLTIQVQNHKLNI